jgi:hypothetical protein
MSHKHALQVSSATAGPVLTPAQKRFNTLVRQIQQARGKLTSWGEASGPYRQSHAEIVVPLQSELTALRRQWVLALDALLSERRWTKAERETMRDIVCSEAGDLLMVSADDEPLKAVFATHAGVDFETERQQMVLAMKDLTEAMTGLDLGDDEGLDTLCIGCARACRSRHLPRRRSATPMPHAAARRPHSSSAARPRRSRPRNRCARSIASLPAPCTPTVRRMHSNARPRPN